LLKTQLSSTAYNNYNKRRCCCYFKKPKDRRMKKIQRDCYKKELKITGV